MAFCSSEIICSFTGSLPLDLAVVQIAYNHNHLHQLGALSGWNSPGAAHQAAAMRVDVGGPIRS